MLATAAVSVISKISRGGIDPGAVAARVRSCASSSGSPSRRAGQVDLERERRPPVVGLGEQSDRPRDDPAVDLLDQVAGARRCGGTRPVGSGRRARRASAAAARTAVRRRLRDARIGCASSVKRSWCERSRIRCDPRHAGSSCAASVCVGDGEYARRGRGRLPWRRTSPGRRRRAPPRRSASRLPKTRHADAGGDRLPRQPPMHVGVLADVAARVSRRPAARRSASASGSSTANSSPPSRATVSDARSAAQDLARRG